MFMPTELMTNGMSYVYANQAYDQFVNAHVGVYDRWASPFSISIIMHAHLPPEKKKNMSYVYARQASVCQKNSYYAQARRAPTMKFFGVNTLPVGYI
jgi:hypothetical protein